MSVSSTILLVSYSYDHDGDVNFRWDLKCIDELPDYLKIFYYELLNVFNEMDKVLSKEGKSYRVPYAIQAVRNT